MSKLDWFTILVIAVCVLAIGALIWNAKNLYQDTDSITDTDISEDYTDITENDAKETYDIDVDGDGDGDNGVNTNSSAGGGSAIKYDSDVAREAAEADAEEARMAEKEAAEQAARSNNSESGRINTNTSPSNVNSGISTNSNATNSSDAASRTQATTNSEGAFMVLIGSYTQMISAERMLRSVRSKGYRLAQIEKFNYGKYARILVDRRATLNSARDLQAELLGDGFRDIQIKEK